MFKHFFEARDAFDAWLLSDPPSPDQRCAFAVFRILLENTRFTAADYGWVVPWRTSQRDLAVLSGYSRRQVVTAMQLLQDTGMIKRYSSRNGHTGSQPDRIEIVWEAMHASSESAAIAHPARPESAMAALRE